SQIFVGQNGIRSGWRILIFLTIIWTLGQTLLWILIHVLNHKESQGWNPVDFIDEGGLFFFSALVAATIMSRIEKRSFRDYGLSPREAFGSLFWFGMLWGFATSALEVLLIYFAGGLSFHGLALHGQALISSALLWLIAMILLGLWEEFIF